MTATLTKDAERQAPSPGDAQQEQSRRNGVAAADLLRQAAARYADLLYQEMRATYQATVAGLCAAYQSAGDALGNAAAEGIDAAGQAAGEGLDAAGEAVAGNPLTLEAEQQLRDLAQRLAGDRLDRYGERLRAFLATQPDAQELAAWLAERARSDAGIWARGDSLAMRRQARRGFYARNRPPAGRWTIRPEGAKEPACEHIAGRIYDGYAEAEAALDGAWHPNCVHWVDSVRLLREATGQGRDTSRPTEDGASGEDQPSNRSWSPSGRLLGPSLNAARLTEDEIRNEPREIAAVFDRTGRQVLRREGTRQSVPIYRSDRDLLRGRVFTHNHPGGGSFSMEDVAEVASWANLAELRAVGPTGRYSLRPGKRGWPDAQRFKQAYPGALRAAKREASRLVKAGTIPLSRYDQEVTHFAMVRLAREFGLIYEREE